MSNSNRNLTSYEQILESALKKEKAAYEFYDNHLKNTNIEILQDIFEELRDEEARHVEKIRNKLDDIRLGL